MLGRDAADLDERPAHPARRAGTPRSPTPSRCSAPRDLEPPARARRRLRRRPPGEVVGLAGLLGSGRSETAKAIFGALPLDSGEVTVDGTAAAATRRPASRIRAGIAMLPEDRKAEGIIPDLSVRDNIGLAALPQLTRGGLRLRARLDDDRRGRSCDRLRIKASSPQPEGVASCPAATSRRCCSPACSASTRKVLLLDEPTRGIDVGAKAEVQALIAELAEKGLAVVLISSELEEVVEGSDTRRRAARRRAARLAVRRRDHGGRHHGHDRRGRGRPRSRWTGSSRSRRPRDERLRDVGAGDCRAGGPATPDGRSPRARGSG